MAQDLVLRTEDKPTFWNKEAAIGLLLFPPLGAVVGAVLGKNRMENEQVAGKVVSDKPGFWNKDTLLGGLLGATVGLFVAKVMVVTAFVTASPMLAVAAPVIAIGSLAAGTYIGGKAGESRQAQEYETAQRQQVSKQLTQNVSPEVGQAVEYAMEHNKEWAKQVLADKLLAAGKARG